MTARSRRTDAAADRFAVLLEDIRDAAGGIQTLFAREHPFIPSLENVDVRSAVGLIATIASNLSEALPARDEETADALAIVEERWQEVVVADGPVSDATYNELEQFASPYALMFFYEIRRLERLLDRGTSGGEQ